ncbi:sperm acrosome membrane-associated protein 4-like isoform X2 [Corythoichthys intestinalis]|uniref:sperm acrosome membrane-associated protein 4-like isoform X2 n=1 Tax=Corythoichthys intestinalis TaxID=161448 RepID=UPI0025A58065|nr:sperm acrosome membrane-associated protein 4-like isoform X2 [Corythoichthys intestinalis]
MNRIIFQLVVVGVLFAVGQALKCYSCSIGYWNKCVTTEMTCPDGERCYSGKGKADNVEDAAMKGCAAVEVCGTTVDEEFTPEGGTATTYKMKKICCTTDLCNAAPGVSSSALVLSTIAALLMAHILV